MNKKELSLVLRREYGFDKAECYRILNTILDTIKEELKKGNLVRLRNFGTFQARKSHGKIRAKFKGSMNFFN